MKLFLGGGERGGGDITVARPLVIIVYGQHAVNPDTRDFSSSHFTPFNLRRIL